MLQELCLFDCISFFFLNKERRQRRQISIQLIGKIHRLLHIPVLEEMGE
jgi:hypothetical protein